jgi:predicted RNA-binding protein YlxR (DUF448 family)
MGEAMPERRCIVTGETGATTGLVRFALAPDGRVVPDVAERLPGRGVWVAANREAVTAAATKGLFARGFKGRALADADLADQVEGLLAARCRELLGLARRAGQAVAGFEKVRALLTSGGAALLLEASDGAEDGMNRLRRLAPEITVVRCLGSSELGAALGRDIAVHVALKPGGLVATLERELIRLAGFRDLARVCEVSETSGGKHG